MAGIETIGLIVGLAGSVVSGMGQVAAMQNQSAMAAYQASVAEMNKQIAEENARRAIEVSQVQQVDQDMISKALLGEQIAVQGASGLSLAGRSQMLTRKSAAELGRRDALNIRQEGELKKYAFLTDAANFGAQSTLKQMESSAYSQGAGFALLSTFLGAGGSLLTKSPTTGSAAFTARSPLLATSRSLVG